jgi:glycosyltransferase involved in cell wall biosynthesis
MKICLVTAFPPSHRPLNEYGFHVARELNQKPELAVTVLADDLPSSMPELPGYSVVRCWDFDSLKNPVRLLTAIRAIRPEVVWFNLGFASFGSRPLPAFLSLTTPSLSRLCGFYTHVTLHQLVETVNLTDAGVTNPGVYRFGGALATHLLLSANSLSVLLPAYRRILWEKYTRGSVFVRPHGALFERPEPPDFSKRGNPSHRILAFGKWGTYKRLELLAAAFWRVAVDFPQVQLLVAGVDHPKTPGYLAEAQKYFAGDPRAKFLGYIPEDDIPSLFQSASVAVMPYSSSAGSSGAAHLACAYSVPIVASDIPDFRELVEEEGLAIELFEPGNASSLAERLLFLLRSPEALHTMARRNFTAALHMSMPQIISQYLRSFELQHRLRALRAAARLRKFPLWLPFRPILSRSVAKKFASWGAAGKTDASPARLPSLLPSEGHGDD